MLDSINISIWEYVAHMLTTLKVLADASKISLIKRMVKEFSDSCYAQKNVIFLKVRTSEPTLFAMLLSELLSLPVLVETEKPTNGLSKSKSSTNLQKYANMNIKKDDSEARNLSNRTPSFHNDHKSNLEELPEIQSNTRNIKNSNYPPETSLKDVKALNNSEPFGRTSNIQIAYINHITFGHTNMFDSFVPGKKFSGLGSIFSRPNFITLVIFGSKSIRIDIERAQLEDFCFFSHEICEAIESKHAVADSQSFLFSKQQNHKAPFSDSTKEKDKLPNINKKPLSESQSDTYVNKIDENDTKNRLPGLKPMSGCGNRPLNNKKNLDFQSVKRYCGNYSSQNSHRTTQNRDDSYDGYNSHPTYNSNLFGAYLRLKIYLNLKIIPKIYMLKEQIDTFEYRKMLLIDRFKYINDLNWHRMTDEELQMPFFSDFELISDIHLEKYTQFMKSLTKPHMKDAIYALSRKFFSVNYLRFLELRKILQENPCHSVKHSQVSNKIESKFRHSNQSPEILEVSTKNSYKASLGYKDDFNTKTPTSTQSFEGLLTKKENLSGSKALKTNIDNIFGGVDLYQAAKADFFQNFNLEKSLSNNNDAQKSSIDTSLQTDHSRSRAHQPSDKSYIGYKNENILNFTDTSNKRIKQENLPRINIDDSFLHIFIHFMQKHVHIQNLILDYIGFAKPVPHSAIIHNRHNEMELDDILDIANEALDFESYYAFEVLLSTYRRFLIHKITQEQLVTHILPNMSLITTFFANNLRNRFMPLNEVFERFEFFKQQATSHESTSLVSSEEHKRKYAISNYYIQTTVLPYLESLEKSFCAALNVHSKSGANILSKSQNAPDILDSLKPVSEIKTAKDQIPTHNSHFDQSNASGRCKFSTLDVYKSQSLKIRNITLTPFLTICLAPFSSLSNRVLRNFNPEYFLRVHFKDENGEDLKKLPSYKPIYERIRSRMREGIKIGKRRYFFLATSASQLKMHSAWFVCPYHELVDLSVDKALFLRGAYDFIRDPVLKAFSIYLQKKFQHILDFEIANNQNYDLEILKKAESDANINKENTNPDHIRKSAKYKDITSEASSDEFESESFGKTKQTLIKDTKSAILSLCKPFTQQILEEDSFYQEIQEIIGNMPKRMELVGSDFIRAWMGNYFKIKNIGKYAIRLGQALSGTLATLFIDDVVEIEDINRNGYCFSDGVGRIPLDTAIHVCRSLNLKHIPAAFQIRLGGYKGVVSYFVEHSKKLSDITDFETETVQNEILKIYNVSEHEYSQKETSIGKNSHLQVDRFFSNSTLLTTNPVDSVIELQKKDMEDNLNQEDSNAIEILKKAASISLNHLKTSYILPKPQTRIYLRDSMKKFESAHNQLEIVSFSQNTPCYLNRQIIFILCALGVDKDVISAMHDDYIFKIFSNRDFLAKKFFQGFQTDLDKEFQEKYSVTRDVSFTQLHVNMSKHEDIGNREISSISSNSLEKIKRLPEKHTQQRENNKYTANLSNYNNSNQKDTLFSLKEEFLGVIQDGTIDFFTGNIQNECLKSVLEAVKSKSRVFVCKGRLLIGILDEYGVLEENEIYVRHSICEEDCTSTSCYKDRLQRQISNQEKDKISLKSNCSNDTCNSNTGFDLTGNEQKHPGETLIYADISRLNNVHNSLSPEYNKNQLDHNVVSKNSEFEEKVSLLSENYSKAGFYAKPVAIEFNKSTNVVLGTVCIAKNPCLHPGDIRTAKAVYKEQLSHLFDVVVFSSKGKRPLFNMCSGSDLDGDQYAIIWDERLIPKRLFEPDNYTSHNALKKQIVTMNDVVSFYLKYLQEDELGLIAHAHLAHCDKFGLFEAESLKLASLFNKGVDFPKTGYVAKIPHDLIPKYIPDYMEKNSCYHSRHVIGIMYRRAKMLSNINYAKSDMPATDLDETEYRFYHCNERISTLPIDIPSRIKAAVQEYKKIKESLKNVEVKYHITNSAIVNSENEKTQPDRVEHSNDLKKDLQRRLIDARNVKKHLRTPSFLNLAFNNKHFRYKNFKHKASSTRIRNKHKRDSMKSKYIDRPYYENNSSSEDDFMDNDGLTTNFYIRDPNMLRKRNKNILSARYLFRNIQNGTIPCVYQLQSLAFNTSHIRKLKCIEVAEKSYVNELKAYSATVENLSGDGKCLADCPSYKLKTFGERIYIEHLRSLKSSTFQSRFENILIENGFSKVLSLSIPKPSMKIILNAKTDNTTNTESTFSNIYRENSPLASPNTHSMHENVGVLKTKNNSSTGNHEQNESNFLILSKNPVFNAQVCFPDNDLSHISKPRDTICQAIDDVQNQLQQRQTTINTVISNSESVEQTEDTITVDLNSKCISSGSAQNLPQEPGVIYHKSFLSHERFTRQADVVYNEAFLLDVFSRIHKHEAQIAYYFGLYQREMNNILQSYNLDNEMQLFFGSKDNDLQAKGYNLLRKYKKSLTENSDDVENFYKALGCYVLIYNTKKTCYSFAYVLKNHLHKNPIVFSVIKHIVNLDFTLCRKNLVSQFILPEIDIPQKQNILEILKEEQIKNHEREIVQDDAFDNRVLDLHAVLRFIDALCFFSHKSSCKNKIIYDTTFVEKLSNTHIELKNLEKREIKQNLSFDFLVASDFAKLRRLCNMLRRTIYFRNRISHNELHLFFKNLNIKNLSEPISKYLANASFQNHKGSQITEIQGKRFENPCHENFTNIFLPKHIDSTKITLFDAFEALDIQYVKFVYDRSIVLVEPCAKKILSRIFNDKIGTVFQFKNLTLEFEAFEKYTKMSRFLMKTHSLGELFHILLRANIISINNLNFAMDFMFLISTKILVEEWIKGTKDDLQYDETECMALVNDFNEFTEIHNANQADKSHIDAKNKIFRADEAKNFSTLENSSKNTKNEPIQQNLSKSESGIFISNEKGCDDSLKDETAKSNRYQTIFDNHCCLSQVERYKYPKANFMIAKYLSFLSKITYGPINPESLKTKTLSEMAFQKIQRRYNSIQEENRAKSRKMQSLKRFLSEIQSHRDFVLDTYEKNKELYFECKNKPIVLSNTSIDPDHQKMKFETQFVKKNQEIQCKPNRQFHFDKDDSLVKNVLSKSEINTAQCFEQTVVLQKDKNLSRNIAESIQSQFIPEHTEALNTNETDDYSKFYLKGKDHEEEHLNDVKDNTKVSERSEALDLYHKTVRSELHIHGNNRSDLQSLNAEQNTVVHDNDSTYNGSLSITVVEQEIMKSEKELQKVAIVMDTCQEEILQCENELENYEKRLVMYDFLHDFQNFDFKAFLHTLTEKDAERRGNILFGLSTIVESNQAFKSKLYAALNIKHSYDEIISVSNFTFNEKPVKYNHNRYGVLIVGMFDQKDTFNIQPARNPGQYVPVLNNLGVCTLEHYKDDLRSFVLHNIGFFTTETPSTFRIRAYPGQLLLYGLKSEYVNNHWDVEQLQSKINLTNAIKQEIPQERDFFCKFTNLHDLISIDYMTSRMKTQDVTLLSKTEYYILKLLLDHKIYHLSFVKTKEQYLITKISRGRQLISQYAIFSKPDMNIEISQEVTIFDRLSNLDYLHSSERILLGLDVYPLPEKGAYIIRNSPDYLQILSFSVEFIVSLYLNCCKALIANFKSITSHQESVKESSTLLIHFKNAFEYDKKTRIFHPKSKSSRCYVETQIVMKELRHRHFNNFFERFWSTLITQLIIHTGCGKLNE